MNSNSNISNNSSIKEYYIKLETMMTNAVNMLTALNKALSTTASEISVNVINTNTSDNAVTKIRIPSFLYIENKVEQIDNIINNLFKIPKTGEAWFEKSSNMYKLALVKSNNAPTVPTFSNIDSVGFNIKENNIFKDLVNPKTYIRLNIENIADNINNVYVKKIVLYNSEDAEYLKAYSSYSDVKGALFNKQFGVDYEEYETIIDLPIKEDKFKSFFKILEHNQIQNSGNSIMYTLRLDTLTYYNSDDASLEYTLNVGDLICLSNEYAIYRIKDIQTIYNNDNDDDTNEYYITVEEHVGHVSLMTYEENSEMYLQIYNDSYAKYHYVDIPLEENENIILFISTIYNNVRSSYSDAIHLNLNNIYMKDVNGNYILDQTGNKISYIEYYNEYCKNIGDLMTGITKISYPQISNFNNAQLRKLTDSEELKNIVTQSLYYNNELVLNVSRINSHLIDDELSQSILSLHSQKNEINSQLRSVQDNIDQTYSQLTETDFSQESNVTQESLRGKLKEYYNERIALEKQLLNIVDNINQSKNNVFGLDSSKYRVRGVTDANDRYDSSIESPIMTYLHNEFGYNCNLIGLEIDYKYKSATKDSTAVANDNANILFTDWNRAKNIDRERYLKFDAATNKYEIAFSTYNTTSNIIKWNQIDIPINQGEDVVVRIRYKYNIGQPFINLYTPWSEEVTVKFPVEYTETTEISSILETNDNDVVNAKFIKTLVNDGYEDHISNKLIDNSQIFYHMPENIYSGFNTPENKLISLKDKLQSISNDISTYKAAIESEINSNYEIYIEWDNNSILLSNLTSNNIVINELVNGATDMFIKKNMNLIIKNTGVNPIKLYSIFPGNVDIPLIETDNMYFNNYIANYERVPMLLNGSSIPSESIIPQVMGQWIYFRQNNPFTNKSLYYDDSLQRQYDTSNILNGNVPTFTGQLDKYLGKDNLQVLLPYRNRNHSTDLSNYWGFLTIDGNNSAYMTTQQEDLSHLYSDVDKFYIYENADDSNNSYILKYEHLINTASLVEEGTKSYLSNNISISEFVKQFAKSSVNYYNGAFLIPELVAINQIICDSKETNQYKLLDVGKSLSIPILFEYFLIPENNSINVSISKTLAFDIKPSLMRDPEHYILTVTAKYDYSQTLASTQSYSTLVDGLKSI